MHPEGLRFDPAWLHQLPAGIAGQFGPFVILFCNNSVKDMASATMPPGWQQPGNISAGEMYAVLNKLYKRNNPYEIVTSREQFSAAPGLSFWLCGQATKRVWWMPWQPEAMKDVVDCEKLRGAVKQALIRRCPNGETRPFGVIAH